jgi:hypothetical protein
MTLRFPDAAARVSKRSFHEAIVALIVGCLALASAGCFHFGAKSSAANAPTQQQMEAYAEQQTALRTDASQPNGESQEHCDQLATAPPGVEELRINHGAVESRQWTLLANGSVLQWSFVRVPDGSPEGWAPKPGLDKLNFQPPLEPVLTAGSNHFLAYAPIESNSPEDSRKSATARAVFGPSQGNFTWRGRKYSYTLTPELPCFPRLQ